MVLPRHACRVLGEPRWHGRTEWLLEFGWTDQVRPWLPAAPARVAALLLARVPPALLQSIQVLACGQPRYSLEICEGRRGQLASAGELLLAMAAAQGRHGLHIDAVDLDGVVPLEQLTLRLRLWDEATPAAQVQVQVADRPRMPLAVGAPGLPAQCRPAA